MAQLVTIASQSLDDVVVEAIDVFHIVKFPRTPQDNLSGFETTMVEQERKPFFTFVREHRLDTVPEALVAHGVCCSGFLGAPWLWKR